MTIDRVPSLMEVAGRAIRTFPRSLDLSSVSDAGRQPSLVQLVQALELVPRDGVGVTAVPFIEDQIVSRVVAGAALLGLHGASVGGDFRPDRRGLHPPPGTDLPIGAHERTVVDRVHVTIVVDDPVTRLAALLATPLSVGEAGCFEVEPYGKHEAIGPFSVLVSFAHRALDQLAGLIATQPILGKMESYTCGIVHYGRSGLCRGASVQTAARLDVHVTGNQVSGRRPRLYRLTRIAQPAIPSCVDQASFSPGRPAVASDRLGSRS